MVRKETIIGGVEFVAIQLSRVAERVANIDRLEEILGAPILRIEAVDVLSDRWSGYPYCSSYASKHGGRSLKATEIACFASHIETLRHAATSGAKATVVFEDDAKLRDGINATFLRDRISEVPADADLVTTVRQDHGKPEPLGGAIGWVRPYRSLPWGTSSLVLFPGTYQRLAPHFFPISVPIDVFFHRAVEKELLTAYGPAEPGSYWTSNGPFRSQLHVER